MKINEQWEELKAESHANIESEKGILNRQIRSIQTEGHFGDIKENENCRRFTHRSTDKVYIRTLTFLIGINFKDKNTPTKMLLPKSLHFCGVLLFYYISVRNRY